MLKGKKTTSIKWKMIGMSLLYWLIPFFVILGLVGWIMGNDQEKNEIRQMTSQIELNNQICGERLEGAIAASRQATYDKTLYGVYLDYKKQKEKRPFFFSTAKNYISQQYGKRRDSCMTVLMIKENPWVDQYAVYNSGSGGSFDQVQDFWAYDAQNILDDSEDLDTAIGFYYQDGRFYLVRNMVDSTFKTWAVLVQRLNMDYCFATLVNYPDKLKVRIQVNGQEIFRTGQEQHWAELPAFDNDKKTQSVADKKHLYVYQRLKDDDFLLTTVIMGNKQELFGPLYSYQYTIMIMILFLIPMAFVFLALSRRYLSGPVEEMLKGARKIEEGNLGYQIEKDTRTKEFEYLRESFNHMSKRLKYQFDHIYEEEIALRDAKIMALQSHINPHFMNNTLEIINWEARLSGNEKVSKMIESLSILMDAAIDRKKLPVVPMAEELRYVNAYLYIMKERLGKRLTVTKDIPEELMQCPVPRLILQPIIENAIEHGVVPGGEGEVSIRGWREENFLFLEVVNDGEFTKEDEAKVARLLDPTYDTSKETSGNLGISNVNQRLKIIYGDQAGLTLRKGQGHHVVAKLTILVES